MPPKKIDKKSNKQKQKDIVLTDVEKKWQVLIDRHTTLLKDMETYIEENIIELFKPKLGGKKPGESYQFLLKNQIGFKFPSDSKIYDNCINCIETLAGTDSRYHPSYRLSNTSHTYCLKKEAKNLYYGRKFAYNNNNIYGMMLTKYYKNIYNPSANNIITQSIKLLLHVGYSLDNLIVSINLNIVYKSTIGFYVNGILYYIYLYDPNSDTAKSPSHMPMPLTLVKQLDNLAYKNYRDMCATKQLLPAPAPSIHGNSFALNLASINSINAKLAPEDRYEPVTRYVRAEDFFEEVLADNVPLTTTTDTS